MDIKKMLYFKTIVEQGQISKAARILHISQPPLSQRLKELEEELGVTLIERSGHNWNVTSAGRSLYHRALHILDLVDDIPAEIKSSQKDMEGLVIIGCSTLFMTTLMKFVSYFNNKHPNVKLRILIDDTSTLEHKLREHVFNFCLMLMPHFQSGLNLTPMPASPLVLVASHDMATDAIINTSENNRKLDLKELHNKSIAICRRPGGGGLYNQVMETFSKYGVEPNIILDCPDCSAMLSFIEKGLKGLAIAPVNEVPERMFETHYICELPDFFPVVQPYLAMLEKRYMPRVAQVVYEELQVFVNKC